MSDKEQSTITEEKENDFKQNKITKKWKEKKQIRIGKKSIFVAFIVIFFLIDLLFVIIVDFSIIDIIIGCDLFFSKSFNDSSLGIFIKIVLLGATIGSIIIFFESFFKKN